MPLPKPPSSTPFLTCALGQTGSTRLGQIQTGFLLLPRNEAAGSSSGAYSSNRAIQSHGRSGNTEAALAAFLDAHRRNLFTWSALMAAFAQKRQLQQAGEVFRKMPARDGTVFDSMLWLHAQAAQKEQACAIFFGSMPERTSDSWNALLLLGMPEAVFSRMPAWNVVSWTLLLNAYAHAGDVAACSAVFDAMPERSVVTWTAMVQALASGGLPDAARRTFDAMPGRNAVSWSTLVAAYARAGQRSLAAAAFHRMPAHGVVAWTALLQSSPPGCSPSGIFRRMPERNVVTWNVLLAVASSQEEAEEAYRRMPQRNAATWQTMLSRSDVGDGAKAVFDSCPERGIASWNSLAAAYAAAGDAAAAAEAARLMPATDAFTSATLLTAFARAGQLGEAEKIFFHAPEHSEDPACCSAIISAYASAGMLDKAKEVFSQLASASKRSSSSSSGWNAMLDAYARFGIAGEAGQAWREMVLQGDEVGGSTLAGVLAARGRRGDVEGAAELLRSMVADFGVGAEAGHYCSLVDALARSGRLDEAEELAAELSSSSSSSASAWTALLSACANSHDLERGRRAAAQLQLSSPLASYLLLARAARNP